MTILFHIPPQCCILSYVHQCVSVLKFYKAFVHVNIKCFTSSHFYAQRQWKNVKLKNTLFKSTMKQSYRLTFIQCIQINF